MPPSVAWTGLAAAVALAGCSSGGEIVADDAASCVEVATAIALPESVPETSGVAFGRRDSTVIWTHNDSGGEPRIFAVDQAGEPLGSVRVAGADAFDWEDMESASCGTGSCLYLADVGDNAEVRDEVVVYRVPEPSVHDQATAEADVLAMTYPDGPRDAEAIFVLPGERLFVVSKGRSHPPALYRYPGALRPGERVMLERVRALGDSRPSVPDQITGAGASPNGDLVALRTYVSLMVYRVIDGELSEGPVLSQNLRSLEEPQGEAVAVGDDGLVALTTEAGRAGRAGLAFIRCRLGG